MKLLPLIPWFCLMAAATADQLDDLLRFNNGDQLRGRFIGLKEGPQVVWQNEDLAAPADFKTERIRQIVLRGGRPLKPLATLAHLGLVNGDRFPGTVTALDADTLTLETPFAGSLRIPRDQVSLLAANPLGGRIYYQGPFAGDEWRMAHPSFPDGLEAPAGQEDAEKNADEKPGEWAFSGSAWYWQHKQGGTALIRDSGMPERSILRFEVAWKTRLNLAIAFHADFARSVANEEEKPRRAINPMDATGMTRMFGNSYVLQLYSNYLTLFRTTVNEDGKPGFEREHRNSSTLRLGDSGQADIELRSNRRSGEISLFVNDEFVTQWNGMDLQQNRPDGDESVAPFPDKGTGFGFIVQGDDSPARISDIIVSEWNGMPDSARSLQVDDKDVVLMSNGTDRYAGRVGALDEQGRILFEGRHGRFQFPLEDVAEIRFARNNLATPGDPPENNLVVRFGPIGSVSGQAISGDADSLDLLSPVAGRLKVLTAATTLIEFNSTKLLIDDWNPDF
ncbi:MAG: hypothetical protein MUF86_03315 [Akkermansiaceae bacterium]|jgi:hypothetical protein|nr:hypothetical protein [Akkermansiaceae bacterium]